MNKLMLAILLPLQANKSSLCRAGLIEALELASLTMPRMQFKFNMNSCNDITNRYASRVTGTSRRGEG